MASYKCSSVIDVAEVPHSTSTMTIFIEAKCNEVCQEGSYCSSMQVKETLQQKME